MFAPMNDLVYLELFRRGMSLEKTHAGIVTSLALDIRPSKHSSLILSVSAQSVHVPLN